MTTLNLNSIDRSLDWVRRPFILATILLLVMGLDGLVQRFAHLSSPGLFLLPAIAVIGMARGLRSALVASGASVLFVALAYSTGGSLLTLRSDAMVRLCVFSVSAPVIALVVGVQRKLLDDAYNGRLEQALRNRAAELAELAQALQHSNQELDQFAYVTSHDLKAPLRGINNLSQWIEEDLGDRLTPQARGQLQMLRGRVERMESLINGLLDYAHVGRMTPRLESVDVQSLLQDVRDWVDTPDNVEIRVEQPMPTFSTDRLRLQQVFSNLIENAVKHRGSNREGRIVVRCTDEVEFYKFAVSDNGQGIDAKYHERIFAVFQTLRPRDEVEGTGIGLSLVKKIVESKGGSVQVRSAQGHGATFEFTWPKVEPQR